MDNLKELDKILNRKTDFRYPTIDGKRHVRLLRFSHDNLSKTVSYDLEITSLTDLPWTQYRALSYTWGRAQSLSDVREIQIDSQPFFVRQNLFDFLVTATAKGEYGLFFIDAICINQLDDRERQFQVQEMARIYRNANEVIAWLGLPEKIHLDNVRALSQANTSFPSDCTSWTASQWAGFRYLSYHGFWNRIWIVQEVLLASSMTVWCGSFTFPRELFGGASGTSSSFKTKLSPNGRPSTDVSAVSRLCSPAATVITHRLRHVPRSLGDPLNQGTEIGSMEDMMTGLTKAREKIETYQSKIADPLYQIVRKFGKLDCSDPRDRLYGLLGLLNERIRAKVEPNYGRDVSYAYYQALKVGLEELYEERGAVVLLDSRPDADYAYLAYYCDVRDTFGIEDGQSLSILREVSDDLHFKVRLRDATFEVQWQQQFVWRDAEINVYPDFKQLLMHAEEENFEGEGLLFNFHMGQRRMIGCLLKWLHSRSRKYRGWRQIEDSPSYYPEQVIRKAL